MEWKYLNDTEGGTWYICLNWAKLSSEFTKRANLLGLAPGRVLAILSKLEVRRRLGKLIKPKKTYREGDFDSWSDKLLERQGK